MTDFSVRPDSRIRLPLATFITIIFIVSGTCFAAGRYWAKVEVLLEVKR